MGGGTASLSMGIACILASNGTPTVCVLESISSKCFRLSSKWCTRGAYRSRFHGASSKGPDSVFLLARFSYKGCSPSEQDWFMTLFLPSPDFLCRFLSACLRFAAS
jgi:hypothetical protein